MQLRPNFNNSRREKLHRKDYHQVRKYRKNRNGKNINAPTTNKGRDQSINHHNHRYMIRRTKAIKRRHCISCPKEDDAPKLNPKVVLRRCPIPDKNKQSNTKKSNLNPKIRLRRYDIKRWVEGGGSLNDTIINAKNLRPTLALHRCKISKVLDHRVRVVEASRFEMFMVELYPMLIRTWVNPRDFTPQKWLFDEYVKRHAIPGRILTTVATVHPGRIIARRTSPNGDVHILRM